MNGAIGELPHKPGVHRSKQKFAAPRPVPRPLDMIENPLDFGAGKIGVRHEARRFPDVPSKPARNKLVHDGRGTPALPDNRVVDGPPRRLVPDHGGFPLVGNADGGNVFDGNVELGDKLHHHRILGRINLQRIMLDPALAGIDLGEFLLDHSGKVQLAVKQYGAGTGCPLIQRHDIAAHDTPSCKPRNGFLQQVYHG